MSPQLNFSHWYKSKMQPNASQHLLALSGWKRQGGGDGLSIKMNVPLTLVALALVVLVVKHLTGMSRCVRLRLLSNSALDERLVVVARLGGRPCFFQLDTGYAGSPVLSTSYLALDRHADVSDRGYWRTVQALRTLVDNDQRALAAERFQWRSGCRGYTSGCTMRLMGIGSIVEQQADMLLCRALELQTVCGAWTRSSNVGDVFVTNPLHGSCHILTSDYLMHAAPVLIRPGSGELSLRLPAADAALALSTMHTSPLRLVGGAPVVDVLVGGERFVCTLDTGAPGPITLGSNAAQRIGNCQATEHVIQQHGVNGERVCSSVIVASVDCAGRAWGRLPVFVNGGAVDHTDGYVGMAFLRAFDLLISARALGMRPSGLAPRTLSDFDFGTGGGGARCVPGLCGT